MHKWSLNDDVIIRDGYAKGVAARDIAEQIGEGVNRFQVIGRATRLKLKHRFGRRNKRANSLKSARAALRVTRASV